MKFTPQNIARELKRRGIATAKNETVNRKQVKVSGIEIRSCGRWITCEWKDWNKTGSTELGLAMAFTALNDMGYQVAEVKDTGLYRITRGI